MAGSEYALVGEYAVATDVDPANCIVIQTLYKNNVRVGEFRRVDIGFHPSVLLNIPDY